MYLWTLALASLWGGIACITQQREARNWLIAGPLLGLGVWVVASNLWWNPSYTAAAPFHAAFLLTGFFFGERLKIDDGGPLLNTLLALALGLVAWALWQRASGTMGRAQALFETPATLSAVLNMVLVPVLAVLLWGRRSGWLTLVAIVLCAALLAAQSRGGWLGFATGGLACVLIARRYGHRFTWRHAVLVGAVIGAGWLLVEAAHFVHDQLPVRSAGDGARKADGGQRSALQELLAPPVGSAVARLELFDLAWRALQPSAWISGRGYLAFYYVLQASTRDIETYAGSTTYFVHNDYLQTLLELGVIGLLALLALVLTPLYGAWSRASRPGALDSRSRLLVIAAVGSIVSMSAHALVDFPFYIPLCLLLYGIALGLLAGILGSRNAGARQQERGPFMRATRTALAVLAVLILVGPLAAEAAADHAQREWRVGRSREAAFWYEAARRIEPRDWRFHWYAGQFWLGLAQAKGDASAARRADAAFADAHAANPREPAPLVWRVNTHRTVGPLLQSPAPQQVLRQWIDEAATLAPKDSGVQQERARVLSQEAGRTRPQ